MAKRLLGIVASRPNATAYLGHHFWSSVWSGDMDMSTPMGRGPKMKLVMVGNGMAGVRTLEELLKLAPDLYDITVFGAEPHPNYSRVLRARGRAGGRAGGGGGRGPAGGGAEN